MIKIYNRALAKLVDEEQYGGGYLEFLYNKKIGRLLLKVLINPFFSNLYGFYKKSRLSTIGIKGFIKANNIDMSLYEDKKFKSYNEFFTRKLKNGKIKCNDKDFIAPAQSKVIMYKIDKDLKVNIKGSIYTMKELLKEDLDDSYINGNCFIFRLSVDNYHRYCYVDDGKFIKNKKIKGCLHTVSSASKDYLIYKENKREVTFLKTKNFDDIIYIEVGAMLVGDIVNHEKEKFKKGEEKGYFNIGGSTVVVITKDNINIDKDIISNSKKGIEVLVQYGEKIGEVK